MPLLEINNVSKSYQHHFWNVSVTAVRNLTFSVDGHGITGFAGPNGAGKTTSLKILLGLTMPDAGSALIRGVPADLPHARRNVAFVPEQPYFYRHLSVRESLAFFYRLNNLPPAAMRDAISRALAAVELAGEADRSIHTMSKGMQQRLNMAHALLGDPEIFILDEPMSGMDPPGRRLFRDLFRDCAARGACIFFSTHILEDIELLCDRVVALSRGTLAYAGTLAQLRSRYAAGTEIVVSAPASRIREILAGRNVAVTDRGHGRVTVLTHSDADARECQKLLYENSVFLESIAGSSPPLESLLFSRGAEGAA